MRFTRIAGIALLAVAGAGIVIAVLHTPYDPPPFSPEEVSHRVDVLNEAAAVTAPHTQFGDSIRAAHIDLFQRVEGGAELAEQQSVAYRKLYQQILHDNQRFLSLFDRQLTVLKDHGLEHHNNVGSEGIAGAHDHHDASARANFERLEASLARIEQASGVTGGPVRIIRAAQAYKDLTDIMLHMATAPHTVSIPYAAPEAPPRDALAADFETLMRNFKQAQFAPVNSPAYIEGVHRALDAYDSMVLNVQSRIRDSLHPIERTLAGRWLGWQSLTPPLSGYSADRIPRRTLES